MVRIGCFVIVLLLGPWYSLFAQQTDSIRKPQTRHFHPKSIVVPTMLIIGGIAVNGNATEGFKKEIAEERNEYMPKFGAI